jgi:tetratricopeptide (TPR) repeat protein
MTTRSAGGMSATQRSTNAMASTTGRHGGVKTSVRFDVCIDALMNGCVDAFVQVFTLAHRPPVLVDELARTTFSIPDDALPWVEERLVVAEVARRRSDFRAVVHERAELAQYFEQHGDTAEAVRQYQAGLAAASESLDRALEGEAHECLALLYERLDRLAESTVHHETRARLGDVSGDAEVKQRAGHHLVRVYMAQGERAVKESRYEDATTFFDKAVDAAKSAGDGEAEAKAYSALGNVTVLKGDMRKALEYQQRFLVVARSAHDGHGESLAALEVAKLQDSLGHSSEAIESLKTALSVAEQNSDLSALNEACKQLGTTYRNMGQNMKAVHYYKEHFRVSRDIGERETIESARISLGFAMGEHHFTHAGNRRGFLAVVCNDLAGQLAWMADGEL